MAGELTMPHINRGWQILIKGLDEVQQAPHPQAAAEMVIVRLAYAANLPDPGKLVRELTDNQGQQAGDGGTSTKAGVPTPEPAMHEAPPARASVHQNGNQQTQAAQQIGTREEPQGVANANLDTLEDMVTLLRTHGHMLLASQVYSKVRVVTLQAGRLDFVPADGAAPSLASDLKRVLGELTGRAWMVTVTNAQGGATLAESEDQLRAKLEREVRADPLVAGVLEQFPGARIEHIGAPGTASAGHHEDQH
jgi:DNA polymerase-3 subunit gamma/tau